MNGLRLALLLIGLAIIAGIYVWGTALSRRQQRSLLEQRYRDEESLDVLGRPPEIEDPLDYLETPTDLSGSSEARQTEDIRTSSVHPKGSGSQKPIDQDKVNPAVARASQGGSPPTKERIMVMYLTAPAGSSYSGDAIQKAAEAVGMRFGEMGVFHHFGIGKTPPRHSLFCLANLYEPGNFELSSMNTFQTSGLVLFMRLPGPVDGRVAFELMLNTALRLREHLGGELRDNRNEPLGAEQVERLRHRVTLAMLGWPGVD